MPNETLEKLKYDKYVAERKLIAARHKEKRLESELKRLTVIRQIILCLIHHIKTGCF